MTNIRVLFATIAFTFAFNSFALTTQEKLAGPVTEMAKRAEVRHLPFNSNNQSLEIGFLTWKAEGKGGAPIVIVPGRNEVAYQWAETAYDLRTMGHEGAIYVWDPPGQGISDRLIPDDPTVGHIDKFSDYTQSLNQFLSQVKAEAGQAPFVIAHSMGGAISLGALARGGPAQELILDDPMLNIRIPYIKPLFDTVVDLLYRMNLFQKVVLGRNGTKKTFTSDQDRYEYRKQLQAQMYGDHNGAVPGKTLGWIAAANRGIADALATAHKIEVPITVLVGTADSLIDPAGARQLEKNCNGNCRLVYVKGSEHALHEEVDEYRGKLLDELAERLGLDCTRRLTTVSRTFPGNR